MSEQEFKRAFGYANTALDLLHRGRIPPYPQFYELLYTYATGANPQLNARINAIFQSGATPDHDLATKLYDEFLKAHDAHERLNSVSERMSHRIEAVHDAIDAALGNANSFSATLQSVTDGISDAISPEALRDPRENILVLPGDTLVLPAAHGCGHKSGCGSPCGVKCPPHHWFKLPGWFAPLGPRVWPVAGCDDCGA